MKKFVIFPFLMLFILSCAPPSENGASTTDEAFEINSKTVMANLKGWQDENLDYSMYADDFIMLDTGVGAENDSLSLSEMKEMDKEMWRAYDFKMMNEPVLLPGVNPDTKKPNGSVRHYSNWKITLPATDSTDAKSGMIKLYESFDFNDEGKIIYQQVYGDFTGIMNYLHSQE